MKKYEIPVYDTSHYSGEGSYCYEDVRKLLKERLSLNIHSEKIFDTVLAIFDRGDLSEIKAIDSLECGECDCKDLDDYDNGELIDELRKHSYPFYKEISNEQMIELLEYEGYMVLQNNSEHIDNGLDYTDNEMLYAIIEKFKNASWAEKEEIYKNII